MFKYFIVIAVLIAPFTAYSQSEEAKNNVSEYYEHQNPNKEKKSEVDGETEFQRHLRSKNNINHYKYINKRKVIRRGHIRHEVNRKEFTDANDLHPNGKVSSLAVEALSLIHI